MPILLSQPIMKVVLYIMGVLDAALLAVCGFLLLAQAHGVPVGGVFEAPAAQYAAPQGQLQGGN
jgi:hypothetical protein